MKKFYEIPEIEFTVFSSKDIITVSGANGTLEDFGTGIDGDDIEWS